MKNNNRNAFTLIELLMVIAIIGILAGILIPTVGAVRKQANVAASKSQITSYLTAIQMFKGDYGYYPLVTGTGESEKFELNSPANCTELIKTLTGRDTDGGVLSNEDAKDTGNRRKASYLSLSDSDFLLDDADDVDRTQLADRFNNIEITIEIDTDGNGFVSPSPTENPPGEPIRTPLTAYVDADEDIGAPSYNLWD